MADRVSSVSEDYEQVVFDDGISLEEAKTIAQRQLIKKNVVEIYDMAQPKVDEDVAELPDYERYWFIFFEETQVASSIPFIFMAVVDKETGKVKFANDYNEGNRWILEAALLR